MRYSNEIIMLILFLSTNVRIDATKYRTGYFDSTCTLNDDHKKMETIDNKGELSALVLQTKIINATAKNVYCLWEIKSIFSGTVLISIRSINFSGDCYSENLQIIPLNMKVKSSLMAKTYFICADQPFNTDENIVYPSPLTIQLYAQFRPSVKPRSSFELVILAFQNGPYHKLLDFPCQNGMYISSSLRFDGYDHCGDNSDEIGETSVTECEPSETTSGIYEPTINNSGGYESSDTTKRGRPSIYFTNGESLPVILVKIGIIFVISASIMGSFAIVVISIRKVWKKRCGGTSNVAISQNIPPTVDLDEITKDGLQNKF